MSATSSKNGKCKSGCLWILLAVVVWAAPASSQSEAVRLQRAYERIDEFVRRDMQRVNTPGLALAVTSRDGLLHVATYGFADLKARTPVTPDTLFEIGSISKSFTAIALLQLREEGKFDPQAPVSRYLQWFSIFSKFAPITGHHLLTHTAGIPRDRDDMPASLYMGVALRERETGYELGKKFSYSNIGYQVLGYLVEELAGKPYPEIIRSRILQPLEMLASEPSIRHETRRRLAVGYRSFYDDRPAHSSHPRVEATWLEHDAGDGSIVATAADLAAYLRMLLNRGAGPNARILSEESFDLLVQPAIKTGENSHYGYGLAIRVEDGRTLISHGGGMVGYASHLIGDPEAGLGVVVFVNGPGNPGAIAEYALKAVRAAFAGQPLPDAPVAPDPRRVPQAADFAGEYTAEGGGKLTILAEGESLYLVRGGEKIALERRGRDQFYVTHPDYALYLLRFGRDPSATEARTAKVVEASHGPAWFVNSHYTGPKRFESPDEWRAYPGHYRCHSPWFSNFRILLRKGKLLLALPSGGEQVLVPLGSGLFQVGEEETAERLRFDVQVNGRALRANFSGVEFFRVGTP